MEIGTNSDGKVVGSRGVGDAHVNQGKLCVKGIFEHELFESSGRGDKPLIRDSIHQGYREISWDSAAETMADKIRQIQ
ncbi:MAG: nitrate reductase, partial [Cycloclasticus sp.]